jgi:hypothetical protein
MLSVTRFSKVVCLYLMSFNSLVWAQGTPAAAPPADRECFLFY